MSSLETRSLPQPPTTDPTRPNRLVGYAALFDSPSHVLAERGKVFRELIRPGAFTRSLAAGADVFALWDHGRDGRPPLGRTGAGTLKLAEDATGLRFELDLPASAADVREAVERRDVWGMSFGFSRTSAADRWSVRGGENWRELLALDLFEVSVVIRPAYPATSVGVRDVSNVAVPAVVGSGMGTALARLRLAGIA